MNSEKRDYIKGLIYFCGLMLCICLFFTTPDGVSLLYGLLGLVRVNPGIPIGTGGTLYIYGLIPIVAGGICIKKIFTYWQGYGLKFKEYSFALRYLPVFITIPILFVSNIGLISPLVIDRIYFTAISQRGGLQAVTFSSHQDMRYEFNGSNRTFSYDFTFSNHGSEPVMFNAKVLYDDADKSQEVFVMDDNGEAKTFMLSPGQSENYFGTFSTQRETSAQWGSGQSPYTIVLVNGSEQYSPTLIERNPVFR